MEREGGKGDGEGRGKEGKEGREREREERRNGGMKKRGRERKIKGQERSEYQTKQPHGYLVSARHTGMTCCAPSGSPPNGGLIRRKC